METKEKEILEAAKELYEKLHSLDYYGDNFEKWDVDWDGDYEPENLEEWLEDKINGEVFTINYKGNQGYEFAFTYNGDGGWYMGINMEKWYYYDEDIDEIKEIMDDIRDNVLCFRK